MALEELEEQGVLLPEERWGEHELSSTVPRWPLATAFALGVAALAASYLGDGGTWTWVGVGVFLVVLYVATILCDRAIESQRERMERGSGRRGGGTESASEEGAGDDDRSNQEEDPP